MALQKDYLVEKRNILNEIRANNMSLQELRFFSIYLAKINPRDLRTRTVRFSVTDFRKIMNLSKLKMEYMRNVINNLLCKIINVPLEGGGYVAFQLFKECTVSQDDNKRWYVEIDAHDKALPLMFDFKDRYFTYQLWNALKLKSSNQLRMYEILKQYEKIGERVLSVDELRLLLGIQPDEYPRYERFRTKVLESCQKALLEHTDIRFTYGPYGKRGKGGKIDQLKFIIEKNTEYKDQLTFEEFLSVENMADIYAEEVEDPMDFYASACQGEFSTEEIQVLYNMTMQNIGYESGVNNKLKYFDYMKRKYDELVLQASRRDIKNRFAYVKKLMELDSLS
jgi:plasmid replication initiation protein